MKELFITGCHQSIETLMIISHIQEVMNLIPSDRTVYTLATSENRLEPGSVPTKLFNFFFFRDSKHRFLSVDHYLPLGDINDH